MRVVPANLLSIIDQPSPRAAEPQARSRSTSSIDGLNMSYEKLRKGDELNGRLQNQFPFEPLIAYDPCDIASVAELANDEEAERLLAKARVRKAKSKGFRPEMDGTIGSGDD
ncbi:MAG: hypothetical protein Q9205_005810 [Flavoplaca limonia]